MSIPNQTFPWVQPMNQGQPPQGQPPQPQQPWNGQQQGPPAAGYQQPPPQGYPQQPPQPQQPPYGQATPPQGGGIPGPHAAQVQPTTLPTLYMVDDALLQQAQQQAAKEAERLASGGDFRRLKFPPPAGAKDWDAAPVPSQTALHLRFMLPFAPGVLPFVTDETHFWKSKRAPNGTTISCPGKGFCPICTSRDLYFRMGTESYSAHAKNNGKPRTTYYWNVLVLDWPDKHQDQTGKMVPFILPASPTLHTKLMTCFGERGGMNACLDPRAGRSFTVIRKKDGPKEMDVEWNAIPDDPAPLHPYFYGALHNLHDLRKECNARPTQEGMVQAVKEMHFWEAANGNFNPPPDVVALLQRIPTEAQHLAAMGQAPMGGEPAPGQPGSPNGFGYPSTPPVAPPQNGYPQQPAWNGPPQGPPQGQPVQSPYPPAPPQGYPQQPPQGYPQQPPPQGPPQGYPGAPGGFPGGPPPAPNYAQQPGHPTNPPLDQLQGQMRGPPPQAPYQPQWDPATGQYR